MDPLNTATQTSKIKLYFGMPKDVYLTLLL